MNQVTATVTLDQVKGTVKFSFDLQGATELDHELLAATISSGRSVSLMPTHVGNELFAEFTIKDSSIWPTAARAMENRKRVANGQPTIEEEEARRAMAEAAAADAEEKAQEAEKQAARDAQAKQDAADAHIAEVVAATIKNLGHA